MNVPTELTVLLMILALYLAGLGSAWYLVSRLRQQAPAWDRQRRALFDQLRQLQTQVAELRQELAETYGQLGEPYAAAYQQAVASLDQAEQVSARLLADEARPSASRLTTCPWWSAILIGGLLAEWQQRRAWWAQTETWLARADQAHAALAQAQVYQQELAEMAQVTHRRLQAAREQTRRLLLAYEFETRPDLPADNERSVLQEIATFLENLEAKFFDPPAAAPAQVQAAFPLLVKAEEPLSRLENEITVIQARREAAAEAYEQARARLVRFGELLQTEEQAERPLPAYSQAALAFADGFDELESDYQAGRYPQAVERGQSLSRLAGERLAELEALVDGRAYYRDLHEQMRAELRTMADWQLPIPNLYALDRSLALIERARRQQARLLELAVCEDLEELRQAEILPPQALVEARSAFERQRGQYEAAYQTLVEQTGPLFARVGNAVASLQTRAPRYTRELDLGQLARQRADLSDRWTMLKSGPPLPESQMSDRIQELQALAQALTGLEDACLQAEAAWEVVQQEQAQASSALENDETTTLLAHLQSIARQKDTAMAQRAQSGVEQFQQLQAALENQASDFAAVKNRAATLLGEMRKVAQDYSRAQEQQAHQYQKLSSSIEKLRQQLDPYRQHSLRDLRQAVEEPLRQITAWQKTDQPEELQPLTAHNRQGEELQRTAAELYGRLDTLQQDYETNRQRAQQAIAAARSTLEQAERALRERPWATHGTSWRIREAAESQELRQAYRELQRAENDLAKLTDPERRYNLVTAVQDLENDVIPAAQEARQIAEQVAEQAREQARTIKRLQSDLKRALDDGNRQARSILDDDLRNDWESHRYELARLDTRLSEMRSFNELEDRLQQALDQTRQLVGRM